MGTKRRSRSPLLPAGVLALVLLCLGLGVGPGLVEGFAALEWTRHLATRNAKAPRVADARAMGRYSAQAVDGLAPLPSAWEAARLALDFGRNLQPKDAAAARAVLTPVREALERAEASWLRRLGLGGLREELWQAENSLLLDVGEAP